MIIMITGQTESISKNNMANGYHAFGKSLGRGDRRFNSFYLIPVDSSPLLQSDEGY